MANNITSEQYKLFEEVLNEYARLRTLSPEEKEDLIISIPSSTYIDLMCDWAFKHVFGHDERNLIPLLNDILSVDIKRIDFDSNEIDRWKGDDKNVIMDVLCHTTSVLLSPLRSVRPTAFDHPFLATNSHRMSYIKVHG